MSKNFSFVVVITVQNRIYAKTSRVCYGIVRKLRLALPIPTLYASIIIAKRKAVLIKHLPKRNLNSIIGYDSASNSPNGEIAA
ncbi:hypothetical protein [Nostoc piscinale]|uniref:hypothetical protein n=1 Tax=Nostoc piscinale TaxID=224012 RepID=UPI00118771B5|nr:hypothetical protein [Nostoc piscinale]